MKYTLLFISIIVSFVIISANSGPSVEDIQALESLKIGKSIVEDDEERYREIQTSTLKGEDSVCGNCIYGYDFFRNTPTTFALSSNVPVPANYTLGPGDKLKIEYFGNETIAKEGYITRKGVIHLPLLGPVTLAGLTMEMADQIIQKKVSNELIGTSVYLNLSEFRSINVYVVGAAYKPGSYTFSSFTTLTNVIFSSGGVSQIGSLRNIQLRRDGKTIGKYDFYDLLLKGDTSSDLRLQEGDTVFIPLIEQKARIDGAVLRAGIFEIKENETVQSLVDFSGFKNPSDIRIEFSRFDNEAQERTSEIYSLDNDLLQTKLRNGDSLNIISSNLIESNNIILTGEFKYPGTYAINKGQTLLDIINKAGGLTSESYAAGAVFTRKSVAEQQKSSYLKSAESLERSLIDAATGGIEMDGEAYLAISQFIERVKEIEPAGRQVVTVDPFLLRKDPKLNIQLQGGDTLSIPKRSSSISVVGEVLNTASHIYDASLGIGDYLKLSGGLTDGADKNKIFIILPNGQSMQYKRKLFSFDASNNLLPGSTIVVSRNPDPYDWFKLTSIITPVLADLAVSAAAISNISN